MAHVTKIDYAYQADAYFPNLDEMEDWVITGESDEQTYYDMHILSTNMREKYYNKLKNSQKGIL